MNPVADDILMHYGVKRRSGRYPYGSGENPYQHSGDFLSRVQELKNQGHTESEIVKELGFKSSTDYRSAYTIAKNERRRLNVDRAKSLAEDGLGASEIARIMGVKNESTVRSWLNKTSEENMNRAQKTAEVLKKELAEKRVLDVGANVEYELGVSRKALDDALMMLEMDGYQVLGISVPQATNSSHRTTVKCLAQPDVTQRELYQDPSLIQSVGEYHSVDGGTRWDKREYPSSISADRVHIRYGDEGGLDKDGVIEIRPGVADLNLGKSHYAQVRIMVDDSHYLKGMAMYSDNIPDGADIVFNTNKKSGTPKMDVLKEKKDDPENPFGAYIKANGQSFYDDPKGKYTDPETGKKQSLSAINKLKEEGDWDTMSRNLSSQFLSKQPMKLINTQLKLTYADHMAEYDEIMSLTNPTIKKKYLEDFAKECDSAAVHLKAAALPRQETRVILPLTKIKDTEVYAPYLNNGEKVALIRYPHGGTFEIPELTVNNKNPDAKKVLGNATDAIGISSKVAERLSGADFDGDMVTVIPVNNRVRVKSTPALEGLKNFDPKTQYAYHEGMRVMSKKQTNMEMGKISNLITDMTLQGAPESDLAKAVRHSMVVIDAHKHKLDYKQSEKDNDIALLKKKYQIKYDENGNIVGHGGASTIISRHKQTVAVPERRGSGVIDKDTGEVTYRESGRTYIDKKTGEVKAATTNIPLITATKDVRTISSGTPQENAYADYANKMKALANQARKEYISMKGVQRSSSAAKTYSEEVDSLNKKLEAAARNVPRERRAQALANTTIKAKIQAYPELADKGNEKDLAKVKRYAIDDARAAVGAKGRDVQIEISDREWEAIQAGAISHTKLKDILRYADQDLLRQRAMPKTTTQLSTAKINKLNAMKASGSTIAEIANALGVSTSTVSKYLNG